MSASSELNIARRNLNDVLGDSMSLYLQNLNCWFKGKINKEEFDCKAREMMHSETVHLHNEFFLALLAKCTPISSSSGLKDASGSRVSKSSKVKRRAPGGRANMQQRFVQAPLLDYVPQITGKALEEGACPTPLGFVSREGLLPDLGMVHGRMLVSAWETGLSDVQDSAVKLLLLALEAQLKNILSEVVKQRKGYRLRDKRFLYSAGVGVPNPYNGVTNVLLPPAESSPTVVNPSNVHVPCLRPSYQAGEDTAAQLQVLGADYIAHDLEPISLHEVVDALLLRKSCIPCHSVLAPTLERAVHACHHPGHEELTQLDIQAQQDIMSTRLARQQTSMAAE